MRTMCSRSLRVCASATLFPAHPLFIFDDLLRLRAKGRKLQSQNRRVAKGPSAPNRAGGRTSPVHRYFPAQFSPVGPRERTPVATEFVSVVRFPRRAAPGRDLARLGPNGATRGRRPRRGYHPSAPLATGGVSGRVGPTVGAGSGPFPPDTEVVR